MEKKSKMIIASSVLALIAAGGVTVGVTAALFTQSGTAKVHINAGSLNVGFYLTSLEYDEVNPETGMIDIVHTVNLKTEYSSAWDEAAQGVDLAKLSTTVIELYNFYPTMEGVATFKVVNGSDIAINSKVSLSKSGTFAPEEDGGERIPMEGEEELGQLKTEFKWLNTEGTDVIDDETVTILKGGDRSAVLTFEFLSKDTDGSHDNKYQGCDFTIDTLLTATQVVKE